MTYSVTEWADAGIWYSKQYRQNNTVQYDTKEDNKTQ